MLDSKQGTYYNAQDLALPIVNTTFVPTKQYLSTTRRDPENTSLLQIVYYCATLLYCTKLRTSTVLRPRLGEVLEDVAVSKSGGSVNPPGSTRPIQIAYCLPRSGRLDGESCQSGTGAERIPGFLKSVWNSSNTAESIFGSDRCERQSWDSLASARTGGRCDITGALTRWHPVREHRPVRKQYTMFYGNPNTCCCRLTDAVHAWPEGDSAEARQIFAHPCSVRTTPTSSTRPQKIPALYFGVFMVTYFDVAHRGGVNVEAFRLMDPGLRVSNRRQ